MRAPVRPDNSPLFHYTLMPAVSYIPAHRFGTLLYDLEKDPEQKHPIEDSDIEKRMIEHLIRIMAVHDAPPEQYERLGLEVSN